MFRRAFYRGSFCGAVAVSALGAWAILDRRPLHLRDRAVRLLDAARF